MGTPRTLPPDSLDISAYAINGTSVAVLNATEEDASTFRINLPIGTYVLLTSADLDSLLCKRICHRLCDIQISS